MNRDAILDLLSSHQPFDETEAGFLEQTLAFLRARGVTNTNVDHLRSFGRGAQQQQSEMKNLCGKCAGNILVVGPNGVVAPCIMSKAWSVGDLGRQSLDDSAGNGVAHHGAVRATRGGTGWRLG